MKNIEICYLKPSELKHDFGNPRKISEKKTNELKRSLEKLGDHDVIKIDENNNIISGNQRIKAMIQLGIDKPVLCKKLTGYSEKELKAINVQSNLHSGEWDNDKLNEWEDDLKDFDIDLDFEVKEIRLPEDIQKQKEAYDGYIVILKMKDDIFNSIKEDLNNLVKDKPIEVDISR